ncbi:tyrosine-type recombinase/integrase [bacterium]|nr:tyrosine-type recombinase/integrase [bacterium]
MKRPSLKPKLAAYLSIRKALGKPIQSPLILKDLVEYLDRQDRREPITVQVVIDWVCNAPHGRGVSAQFARICLARAFLTYLRASIPDIEIPDTNLIAQPRRPNPYIFSDAEFRKVVSATRELKDDSYCSIHKHTAETLFSLMICTGLRPGEVIKLTITDLVLDEMPPRLKIQGAKFHKSRWVPLHETAADHLRDYLVWRQSSKQAKFEDNLFLSKKGQRVKYAALRRLFLQVILNAEIYSQQGQSSPSLHSLRHTFAVQRMRTWYEEGLDVRALLPSLSVYLGHFDPAATYWYLSATPELLSSAALRFEEYTKARGAI